MRSYLGAADRCPADALPSRRVSIHSLEWAARSTGPWPPPPEPAHASSGTCRAPHGVLILIYHPFQRHHRIAVTGFEGTVTEIGLRYTTLRADDKYILLPKCTLFTNPISILDPSSSPPQSSPSGGS